MQPRPLFEFFSIKEFSLIQKFLNVLTKLIILCICCLSVSQAYSKINKPIEILDIILPGSKGGVRGNLVKIVSARLVELGYVKKVNTINIPGPGGKKGIRDFLQSNYTNPYTIIVGSSSMIPLHLNMSKRDENSNNFNRLIPISSLIFELQGLAVYTKSNIFKNLSAEQIFELTLNKKIVFAGNSVISGVDSIFIKSFLDKYNTKIENQRYIPNFFDNTDAQKYFFSKYDLVVMSSGMTEFLKLLKTVDFDIIALNTHAPIPEFKRAENLEKLKVDFSFVKWVGFLGKQAQPELDDMFKKLSQDSKFKKECEKFYYQSYYQNSNDFKKIIEEQTREYEKFLNHINKNKNIVLLDVSRNKE